MTSSNEAVAKDQTCQLGCNECNLTPKGKKTLTERIQKAIRHLEKSISNKEDEIQEYKDGIRELTSVANSVEAGILPASVTSLLEKLID
jgi:molecular chaperone DnaK (HSP70)